jgi:hypothetical protein
MYPGDIPQVSTSQSSVAQRTDDNLKGRGPRNRSRAPPPPLRFGGDPGGSKENETFPLRSWLEGTTIEE